MAYTIIKDGVHETRELEGRRTVATILNVEEAAQWAAGDIIVISEDGGFCSGTTPLQGGETIKILSATSPEAAELLQGTFGPT